jgi:hypothetical protein
MAAGYQPIRDTADPAYRDEWYAEQCGGYGAYRPLIGALGADCCACTNPSSPTDGTRRFEHDGCDAFVLATPGTAPLTQTGSP